MMGQAKWKFLLLLLGAVLFAPGPLFAQGWGRQTAVTEEEPPKVEPKAEEPAEEVEPAPAPVPEEVRPAPKPEPRRTPRRGRRDTPAYQRLYDAADEITEAERGRYSEADALYQAGRSAYEDRRYELAARYFEKAVFVYPGHKGAQEMLAKTRSLLGVREDRTRETLERMSMARKAEVQETLIELRNAAEKADKLVDEAQMFTEGDLKLPEDEVLTRQIGLLDQAIVLYDRVLEMIRWLPYGVDLPEEERVVKGRRAEAMAIKSDLQEQLRATQRDRARDQAEAARVKERQYEQERLRATLDRAQLFFDRKEYKRCEALCKRILKMDPTYGPADTLLVKSRARRHQIFERENYKTRGQETRATMTDVEEATIPYAERIIYPDYWEDIVARSESGATVAAEEEAWVREIKRKLQERVSFEFVRTPLSEAVRFLQNLTGVNMILDPQAIEDIGDVPITLRVTRMSLDLALGWILRLADLQYTLKDNAVFISQPDRLHEAVQLKIYDVRDLTMKIQHFSGPDFAIEVGGSASSLGAGAPTTSIFLLQGEEEEAITAGTLADMIRERVTPEGWDDEAGTSIEESAGKLIVMQRPEVHRLIDKLLSSLRATQKLQVTIETRILLVRQGFFEEIGYEWTGLGDGDVPTGVGAGAGHEVGELWGPPQSTNPMVAPPVPAVSSGFLRSPSGFGGGTGSMHIAGAISTFRPQASPEEDTMGHAAFSSSNWIEGMVSGLNAHYLYLGNYEAMLMMHLLRIREEGTILTAPRLTLLNTQRGHMFIAQQQAYIADYDVSGTAYDPVIRQFLQGVVFEVRPIVSSDRRYITMELKPTMAELVEGLQEIPLNAVMVLQTDPPLALAITLPIYFPRLELRKVRTTLTVPDGGLILLGGLMKDVKYYAETGVPFISNLPIIGRLFRWSVEDNEKRNLYFMTRAKLLIFEEEERQL